MLSLLEEQSFSLRKQNIKLEKLLDQIDFIRVRLDAPKLDSFYDLSQVCRLLGLSKRTVQRLRAQKKLHYFVIAGRSYYPKKETDQFVELYRTGKSLK